MKLYKFLEYVDNINNENEVNLNDNEVKYLNANNYFFFTPDEDYPDYYLNGIEFTKLSSGEFYIINNKMKCSTIQTLIKQINILIENINKWFDNLLLTSKKKTIGNYIVWFNDGEPWLLRPKHSKSFLMLSDYRNILVTDYGLTKRECNYYIINKLQDMLKIKIHKIDTISKDTIDALI